MKRVDERKIERKIEIQNAEAGGNIARTIGNRGEDPTVKILEERVGFPKSVRYLQSQDVQAQVGVLVAEYPILEMFL